MLKENLEHQYESWQVIIGNGVANFNSWLDFREIATNAEENKENIENKIQIAYTKLISEENLFDERLGLLREQLIQFKVILNEKLESFQDRLFQQVTEMPYLPETPPYDGHQGLTIQRIQQFKQFQADENFVGNQCMICLGEFEIGRNMMRLDCDGQHIFCQLCIEGWFADHNTCPICRHLF